MNWVFHVRQVFTFVWEQNVCTEGPMAGAIYSSMKGSYLYHTRRFYFYPKTLDLQSIALARMGLIVTF